MLGSIIGDIVGSPYEFARCKNFDFELLRPDAMWTDDSICTIAILEWLADGAEDSPQDYLLKWCRRYPNPTGGYGGRFLKWVNAVRPEPYNSWGNGAAMRCLPVAHFAQSYEDALILAKRSAEVTHNHPDGIIYTQATVLTGYFLLKGYGMRQIAELLPSLWPQIDVLNAPKPDELRPHYLYSEAIADTVLPCLSCVLWSDSFEETLRNGISLGGDADTIGAIVGGLAECRYGVAGIPAVLLDYARRILPDDMKAVLARVPQYRDLF